MSNFLQKMLIVIAATLITSAGVFYLQREWISPDPRNVKIDPQVQREVLALLEESKGADYKKKISIFYEIRAKGPKTIPILVRELDNKEPETRAFAVNLLQYCGNPSVIPYLEPRLQDESPFVRKSALVALGGLGAVETVPTIILVLKDKDNFTRCQAAHALGVLKDEQAVPPLVYVLEHDPFSFARQTAANSLGEIGNENAVQPLIESLDDDAPLVRSASMVALNRITGERLGSRKEPWTEWWNGNHFPETSKGMPSAPLFVE